MSGLDFFTRRLPPRLRDNLYLRAFGFFKVPLIFWSGARVVELDDRRTVIRIPLRRRTRNHLRSMYFAVLCVGADVAGGLIAMRRIQLSGQPVSLIFRDFNAEFHRRPEADTDFTCEDGEAIGELVEQAIRSGERVHRTVTVVATTPSLSGAEPVATFRLTLSLKLRARGGGQGAGAASSQSA